MGRTLAIVLGLLLAVGAVLFLGHGSGDAERGRDGRDRSLGSLGRRPELDRPILVPGRAVLRLKLSV